MATSLAPLTVSACEDADARVVPYSQQETVYANPIANYTLLVPLGSRGAALDWPAARSPPGTSSVGNPAC
jgi:hypothetical protein